MPSKPGGAPSRKQLPLPSAPKLDRWGLHDLACECGRCALGFRPTQRQRDEARWAAEKAARRKAEAEAKAAEPAKEEVKRAVTWERLGRVERETAEMLKRVSVPVERPATPEELDELKRQYGFRPRRKP